MSKLKKEHLHQMIENAVSYNQESLPATSASLMEKIKNMFSSPKAYCMTAAAFLALLVAIPPISIPHNLADVHEVYDLITLEIIEDL